MFNNSSNKIKKLIKVFFCLSSAILGILFVIIDFLVFKYYGDFLEAKMKTVIVISSIILYALSIFLKYIVCLFAYGFADIIDNTKSTSIQLKLSRKDDGSICLNCGAKLIPGTSYCGKCGKEIM